MRFPVTIKEGEEYEVNASLFDAFVKHRKTAIAVKAVEPEENKAITEIENKAEKPVAKKRTYKKKSE